MQHPIVGGAAVPAAKDLTPCANGKGTAGCLWWKKRA